MALDPFILLRVVALVGSAASVWAMYAKAREHRAESARTRDALRMPPVEIGALEEGELVVVEGTVALAPETSPLIAPLTARECVGFEVIGRFGDEGSPYHVSRMIDFALVDGARSVRVQGDGAGLLLAKDYVAKLRKELYLDQGAPTYDSRVKAKSKRSRGAVPVHSVADLQAKVSAMFKDAPSYENSVLFRCEERLVCVGDRVLVAGLVAFAGERGYDIAAPPEGASDPYRRAGESLVIVARPTGPVCVGDPRAV